MIVIVRGGVGVIFSVVDLFVYRQMDHIYIWLPQAEVMVNG